MKNSNLKLPVVLAGVTLYTSLAVLTAWFQGWRSLILVAPGFAPMRALSAVSFLLASAAIYLLVFPGSIQRARRWARICALLMVALGVAVTVEWRAGIDLGIDELLVRDWIAVPNYPPGRPSNGAGVMTIFGGIGLVCASIRGRRMAMVSQMIGVAGILAPTPVVLGILYGLTESGSDAKATAPQMVVCMILMSLACVLLRPREGLTLALSAALLAGTDAARNNLRLILAVFLGLPVLSFVVIRSSQAARWQVESTVIVLVSWALAALTLLMVSGALTSYQVELRRRVAERERRRLTRRMERQNLELERKVEARTAALTEALVEIRAAKESAEHANHAKSAMLAAISHELRTPLNGVLGFMQLLCQTTLNEEQRNWVETISGSSRALLSIVNDILDLAKVEAGKMEVKLEPTPIRAMVSEIQALFSPEARRKGIALACRVDPAVPAWIRTDGARLRQILLNLGSNAIKFTVSGSVDLRVSLESGSGEPDRLAFLIADTGPGIPPEKADSLFEPFRQLEESGGARTSGTGLGLAISRKFAGLLGGSVEIASSSSLGTSFRLWIPLEACAVYAEKEPVSGAIPRSLRQLRVLVAEDTPVSQRLMQALLQRMGHDAVIVSSGVECLERLAQSPFDVILMDCQMPFMDGYEATRRIRAGEAGQGRMIPIAALTASVMEGDRRRCEEAGMNYFLSKPVQFEDLAHFLNRLAEYPEAADKVHAVRLGS